MFGAKIGDSPIEIVLFFPMILCIDLGFFCRGIRLTGFNKTGILDPAMAEVQTNPVLGGDRMKRDYVIVATLPIAVLKVDEKEHLSGLTEVRINKIPIVFFTHPSAKVKDLTSKQICCIYRGRITNWKEVGGADLPIVVVRREAGDSSLDILTKIIDEFYEGTITEKGVVEPNNMINTKFVERTPGSIGFGTLGDILDADVEPLMLDGVHPTDKAYKYLGLLAPVYKEEKFSCTMKAFLDFAATQEAHEELIKAEGILMR